MRERIDKLKGAKGYWKGKKGSDRRYEGTLAIEGSQSKTLIHSAVPV